MVIFALGDVEPPQDTYDVDEHGAFSNMDAWTNSSASSVCEMVALVWICNVYIIRRWQGTVEISSRIKLIRVRKDGWISVNSPKILINGLRKVLDGSVRTTNSTRQRNLLVQSIHCTSHLHW